MPSTAASAQACASRNHKAIQRRELFQRICNGEYRRLPERASTRGRVIMSIDRSWWALGLIALALPVLAEGVYAGTYFAVVVRVPLGVFLCPTSSGPAIGSAVPPTVMLATYPRIPRQHWW